MIHPSQAREFLSMTSMFTNFVAVQKNRGDLLHPAQYRSVVEAIRGILRRYQFDEFKKDYASFLQHLLDYTDPHFDRKLDFLPEILGVVYPAYCQMTPNPVSLDLFQSQIIPSFSFLELIRRIVLNRFLYNQIKNTDGSVPSDISTHLTRDWELGTGIHHLTFTTSPPNEQAFLNSGWNGNLTSPPVIFTAQDLFTQTDYLPVILATSSFSPLLNPVDFTPLSTIDLNLSFNDLTLVVDVGGIVTQDTSLVSLSNDSLTVTLMILANGQIKIILDQFTYILPTHLCLNGHIELSFVGGSYLFVSTSQDPQQEYYTYPLPLLDPFTQLTLNTPYQDLFGNPGLRSVVVRQGHHRFIDQLDMKLPDGYHYITHEDGSYLTDTSGYLLVSFDPIPPPGYAYVVNNDGGYVRDTDGSFLLDPVDDPLPSGYSYVIDEYGRYIVDDNGRYLITN